MRGYRIFPMKNQWYFAFIPSNNNKQPMGKSKFYSTKEACLCGLSDFRELVVQNRIDSIESPYVQLERKQKPNYAQVNYMVDNEVIYHSREYCSSSVINSCRTFVVSIFQHIDAYTNNEIKEKNKNEQK